jgi:hypothetical protein
MKKVILLGDSIRMGYDKYVKDALAGVAEVYYPEENCKFAQYLLRFVHDWKATGKWPTDADIVHWNAGLWDVLELYGEEPMTGEAQYAEMIARIARQLRRLFPKAKIVFATSTSVQEEKYRPEFKRHNEIIERYNDIAIKALEGSDCLINDLYSLSLTLTDSCWSDVTHFNTADGRKTMGGRVLDVICRELDITLVDNKADGSSHENYSEKNIGQ